MHHDAGQVALRFDVQESEFAPTARYNVAPQQTVGVVRRADAGKGGERFLDGYRWGLVPFWAKEPGIGNKMINARAETLAEKPSFRNALTRRRCLIPADGFYEWDKLGGTRQPSHFRRRDGGLFAFAGLWEEWRDPAAGDDAPPLRTCTIITTTPNETVGRVHDRMPVILLPEDEAFWLDAEVRRPDDLLPLLAPYPDELMDAYPVSRRVNSPAADDSDLLAPLSGAAPADD
jgi:putative SOS response-associated peptidase YedK